MLRKNADRGGFLINDVSISLVINSSVMVILLVLLRLALSHLGAVAAPSEVDRSGIGLSFDRETATIRPAVWCIEPSSEEREGWCVEEKRIYAPLDQGTIDWQGGTSPQVLTTADKSICWLSGPGGVSERTEDQIVCWTATAPPVDPVVTPINRTGEVVVYRFGRQNCAPALVPDPILCDERNQQIAVGSGMKYERYAQNGRWSPYPVETKLITEGILPLPSGEAAVWECVLSSGDRTECDDSAVVVDVRTAPGDRAEVSSVTGRFCLLLPRWRLSPGGPECLPISTASVLGSDIGGFSS